jgi:hypothetical protein
VFETRFAYRDKKVVEIVFVPRFHCAAGLKEQAFRPYFPAALGGQGLMLLG